MKNRAGMATVKDEDKFYTTAQVAEMFAVTAETVRNWIEAGTLKAINMNRQWRIPFGALQEFAASRYGARS